MKKIVLLLFFPAMAFAQKPQFSVKFSMPYATYVFIERICNSYPDNSFKEVYLKSEHHTLQNDAMLEEYEALDFSQSFNYDEYPFGQKMPFMVTTMVRHNLIESATPEEFQQRSLGLMPNVQLAVLVKVLRAFTPIYNALIYEPNHAAFEKQLKELSGYIAGKDIAGYFDAGLHFYNSQWDVSTPFVINIFPTTGSRGFSATAFVNNAVSELPVTFSNYDVLFSVMLHEIYHILYDQQSAQVKKDIETWFRQNLSASSQYAYLLLNEAMATAMGNGFVYEQLTGATDKDDWYFSPYINQSAQAVYPVAKQYSLAKKPIDKAFVDAYIAAYEKFPGWITQPAHIFAYRAVVADDEADLSWFEKDYRHASVQNYETPLTRAALERIIEKPVTRIIIISKQNNQTLKLVTDTFPELKKYKLNGANEFIKAHFMPDKTWLIIVNRKTASMDEIMKQLKL